MNDEQKDLENITNGHYIDIDTNSESQFDSSCVNFAVLVPSIQRFIEDNYYYEVDINIDQTDEQVDQLVLKFIDSIDEDEIDDFADELVTYIQSDYGLYIDNYEYNNITKELIITEE